MNIMQILFPAFSFNQFISGPDELTMLISLIFCLINKIVLVLLELLFNIGQKVGSRSRKQCALNILNCKVNLIKLKIHDLQL